jgi:hypothetical protein
MMLYFQYIIFILVMLFNCFGDDRVIHPVIQKRNSFEKNNTTRKSEVPKTECDFLRDCLRNCNYNLPSTKSLWNRYTAPADTGYFYLKNCEDNCKHTYFCN